MIIAAVAVDGVVPAAAQQGVLHVAAIELIVIGPAIEPVDTFVAVEAVPALGAEQHVLGVAAEELIVAGETLEPVVAVIAVEPVGACAAIQDVVPVPAAELDGCTCACWDCRLDPDAGAPGTALTDRIADLGSRAIESRSSQVSWLFAETPESHRRSSGRESR